MAGEKARVTVTLDVKMVVDVTDDGYIGTNETVERHMKFAREQAQNWQYFVKKGSLEPEQVRAKVSVLVVSIVPETTQ